MLRTGQIKQRGIPETELLADQAGALATVADHKDGL